VGPLYNVLQQLAEKDGLGISLYLESADEVEGYVLKFKTYRGVDRTSDAVEEPLRLTPNMETLSDLKEVRSIDGYKNVVYVVYQNRISVHYEDPDNIPEGLDRRVMVTDAEGEPVGHKPAPMSRLVYAYSASSGDKEVSASTGSGGSAMYGGAYARTPTIVDSDDIAAFREQNAKDALANHNYIRAVDGQVSQINQYKFGTDYGLGDILELEGLTGIINKARVTEYIRAQDKTGLREYPTLSVVT